MKKYEKPAIEEFYVGATMPLMDSQISGDLPVGSGDEGTGYEDDNFAPGRKDKDYDFSEGW